MRYFALVQYDGTSYQGWQIQPDAISIQEEIEKVLSKILNSPTKIYASGRTDAGVHALGQTFHFDSKEIADLDKFKYALNSLLPKDIHILSLSNITCDMHARYNVKEKTYIYLINMGEYDVFKRNHIYQLNRRLDLSKIKEASFLFVGEHNFMNFTSKDEDEGNFVRNIYSIDIFEENNILTITFKGDGFMKYMVRMIVGALIEVGLSRLDISKLKEIFELRPRKVCSFKAPANGLYLKEVRY